MTVRNEGVKKREIFSWAMFDFANSSYATLVLTVVLSVFFTETLTSGTEWESISIMAWTTAQSVAYALAILMMPYLGNIADAKACKKPILVWSSAICIVFTFAIGLVILYATPTAPQEGYGFWNRYDIWSILLLVALSNTFFSIAETFSAAFLPELAKPESIGRVSSWGWGVGYLGGVLSLIFCVVLANYFDFNLPRSVIQYNAAAMIMCAFFFLIGTLPLMVWLKEHSVPKAVLNQTRPSLVKEFRNVFILCQRLPDFRNFLLCTLGYLSGVAVVISLAGVYTAKTLHWDTLQIVQLIIFVNVMGVPGALFFGWFQDKYGHILALSITLVVWMGIIIAVFFTTDTVIFWILGAFIGICMGASQSAGRALTACFAPKSRLAEFFAIWGLAVRVAWILSPMFVGFLTWLEGGQIRYSFLACVGFFLIGFWFLLRINLPRAIKMANTLENESVSQ